MAIKEYMQFVTFDGGAHWNQLNGPGPFELEWLATTLLVLGGTVKALE